MLVDVFDGDIVLDDNGVLVWNGYCVVMFGVGLLVVWLKLLLDCDFDCFDKLVKDCV